MLHIYYVPSCAVRVGKGTDPNSPPTVVSLCSSSVDSSASPEPVRGSGKKALHSSVSYSGPNTPTHGFGKKGKSGQNRKGNKKQKKQQQQM